MIRRAYSVLCIVSLLLCVTTAVVWIWNPPLPPWQVFQTSSPGQVTDFRLTANNGTLSFVRWIQHNPPATQPATYYRHGLLGITAEQCDLVNGPQYAGGPIVYHGTYAYVQVSFWWLLSLTMLMPILWLLRRIRSHPRPSGFCETCGYNLTGNVSGVCPECGTLIAHESTRIDTNHS